jgi:hypothetical protein
LGPQAGDELEAKRPRVGENEHRAPRPHENHDTEAASSLLGFFTQLERHTSQEDMVHFFEGVQKTAAANVVAGARSPSRPSSSPRNTGTPLSMATGGVHSASIPVGAFHTSTSSRSLP